MSFMKSQIQLPHFRKHSGSKSDQLIEQQAICVPNIGKKSL